MTPTDAPHDAVARGRAAARQRVAERMGEGKGGAVARTVARPASTDLLCGAALVWVGVMVAMSMADVRFGLVLLVFVAGLWLAHQFRRRILPPGIPTWRAWLEDMARQAADKQQQHQRQQGK